MTSCVGAPQLVGGRWMIGLDILAGQLENCIRFPMPDGNPFEVQIQTFYVPPEWTNLPTVEKIQQVLNEAGSTGAPLYLYPALQNTLEPVNLEITLQSIESNVNVKQISNSKNGGTFLVHDYTPAEISLDWAGKTPKRAKPGDIYLVLFAAHYEKSGDSHVDDAHLTEVLTVSGRE